MATARDDLIVPLTLLGAGLGLLGSVALLSSRRVRVALAEASAEADRTGRELRERYDVPTLAEAMGHLGRLQTNLATRVQNRPNL